VLYASSYNATSVPIFIQYIPPVSGYMHPVITLSQCVNSSSIYLSQWLYASSFNATSVPIFIQLYFQSVAVCIQYLRSVSGYFARGFARKSRLLREKTKQNGGRERSDRFRTKKERQNSLESTTDLYIFILFQTLIE
jgi:hypothetical protein